MICSQCQTDNPADASFCDQCGARLDMVCPNCGESNRRTARFCKSCGQGINEKNQSPAATAPATPAPITYVPKHLSEKILASRQNLEGERKHVTVLFADIRGSTALIEGLDPEDAQKIIDPVLHLMMKAVHRYEGTVNQVLGDGIMALFGAPLAHEDHALRACYAALLMQEELKRYRKQLNQSEETGLQIGIGMNTGEVVVRSIDNDLNVDYSALGHTTHLAARMQELAGGGTIVLAHSTLREVEGFIQVRSRGVVQAKGVSHLVEAFELVAATSARTRVQAAGVRGLTPLVGRQGEIKIFNRLVKQTAEGRGQVLAMVGEAGMGKSRLVHEFARHELPPGWLVLEGASVSYGKATPYFPLIEMLRRYFQIADEQTYDGIRELVTMHVLELDSKLRDAIPPLLSLMGVLSDDKQLEANSPANSWLVRKADVTAAIPRFNAMEPQQRRRHTLDAIKRLLVRESRRQPILAVFEDLHWIDTETQVFLDALIESLPLARILLLVDYRPGYNHGWGDKTYYTQLRVEPLPQSSAENLLSHLLGNNRDLASLKQMLLARTEGNPFFAEESVRSLVETGFLLGEKGAYRPGVRLESLRIPATVQNLVADRIDRLPLAEKHLLQTAAVIGVIVPAGLLQSVTELPEGDLQSYLTHLQAGEFLYESNLFPSLEYTFKHALITEVAYGALLHERRAYLHSTVLAALENTVGITSHDHLEKLAHHAYYGELWDKAVTYLRKTGSKAMGRSAYREAVACLDRALVSLQKLPSNRENLQQMIDLRLDFRNALFPLEELDRVIEHLQAAESLAQSLSDKRRLGRIYGYLVHYFTGMGERQKANAAAEQGLGLAAELGDSGLELQLNYYIGRAYWTTGDYSNANTLLMRNLDIISRHQELEAHFDMECPPSVLCRAMLAMGLAETGDFASSIKYGAEAYQIATSIEHSFGAIYADSALGIAHMRKGDIGSAVEVLERGFERCRTADIPAQFPLVASPLGLAYVQTGRIMDGTNLLEQAIQQTASKRNSGQAFRVAWLAEAYLVAGRIGEASDRAQLALDFARNYGEKGREAWILRLIAMIHDRQERECDLVESYFRQALAIATRLGMRPLQAHCHFGLGEVFKHANERKKAAAELCFAIDLFASMDMITPLALAKNYLADVALPS